MIPATFRSIVASFVALALAALLPANAPAAELLNLAAIAPGGYHACALTTGGGVKCWGRNSNGQLGDGTTTDRPGAVDTSGLATGASGVAAGLLHTCALTGDGGVKCWGHNSSGELGDGSFMERHTPVDVSGLANGMTAIAAGGFNTCALTTEGGVKCWGDNRNGELGDGTVTSRITPTDVTGLMSGVTAIAMGIVHTCALTTAGGVKCWGSNSAGQVGISPGLRVLTPVDVPGLPSGVVAITAGNNYTCALTTDGVKCWGSNYGSGGPMDVAGLTSGVSAVAAGGEHTCALTTGGGVKCWGNNVVGQLGDGTTAIRPTPLTLGDVSGLATGATAIGAGQYFTCARTSGGGAKCWGDNFYGELGNGNSGASQPTPISVGTYILQTIAFATLANRDINDLPFQVAATASSGLVVAYSSLTVPVCTVAGSTVTLVEIGICRVAANQGGNSDYFVAPQVVQSFLVSGSAPASATRLGNISTRMQVLTGDNVLIGGFAVAGPAAKTVVVRARGPSLAAFGVTNPLANPMLRLFSGQNVIASNDDWQSGASASTIQLIGFAPNDPAESAILATLQPGLYTAIVSGAGSGTGVGIVEVFEIDHPDSPLANISTRGQVLTGNDVMIGGFIIQGNDPQTVIVRARGPSLAAFGITNALANPVLQLVRSSDQVTIATNDDWGSAANAAQITASGFAPANALESAILITLPPGAYTAIVTGANGGTGVGIVEVFAQ